MFKANFFRVKYFLTALIIIFFFSGAMVLIALNNSLVINFSNMNAYLGKSVYIRLLDANSKEEIKRVLQYKVRESDFSKTIRNLRGNQKYYVEIFVDVNDNQEYDSIPVDHSWLDSLTTQKGMSRLNFQASNNYSNINWIIKKLELEVKFKGLSSYRSKNLVVRVIEERTVGSPIEYVKVKPKRINSGEFTLKLPIIDYPEKYVGLKIIFFIDANRNEIFDPKSGEEGWYKYIPYQVGSLYEVDISNLPRLKS